MRTPEYPPSQIFLTVNGKPLATSSATLAGLLAELSLAQETVVVEHNGRLLSQEAIAGTALAAGDVLELIRFVGGG